MRLCSIASGSSGNCIFVGGSHSSLLVDVGISNKRIEEGLRKLDMTGRDLAGILITHEHSDHIKGLGVLARKHNIPIFASKGTIAAIKSMTSLGKIEEDLFCPIEEDKDFFVGELKVHPFAVSHDAAQPVAYRISNGNKKVAVATDLGEYTPYITENLQNLDALLLEANHDINMLQVGPYPYYLKRRILGERGHLSNESAGRLLSEIIHDKMKAVLLGHLSHENNYEKLAYETVCAEITLSDTPYKATDFFIQVAKRDTLSECITI
ncbi:MAG TPA: MBL fold metallo-hydrolase [Lachnospiraceae bacterium]